MGATNPEDIFPMGIDGKPIIVPHDVEFGVDPREKIARRDDTIAELCARLAEVENRVVLADKVIATLGANPHILCQETLRLTEDVCRRNGFERDSAVALLRSNHATEGCSYKYKGCSSCDFLASLDKNAK